MELFFTTYHYLSFLQPLTLQVQTFDIEHLFSALSKQKFNFKKLSEYLTEHQAVERQLFSMTFDD